MASRFLFTSRVGGVSAPPYDQRNLALHVGDDPGKVQHNRSALARELGIGSDALFFMNQVHGTDIVEITNHSLSSDPHQCDALITRKTGIALAVLVADCAPVLLLGERTSAVIHVGWRGLFGGIVEKVIAAFAGESFRAHIGPTICGRCYEIGDELRRQAGERGFVIKERGLDIPTSILNILKSSAPRELKEAEWSGICTFESAEHFSFRREKVTGRMAGVVVHGS